MLGCEPSIIEMPQERLRRDVLGEDVRGAARCVDLDNPHKIVLHQLLSEKVFELDDHVLCFLRGSNPCCHALPARRVCVDPNVHLLDVECFL